MEVPQKEPEVRLVNSGFVSLTSQRTWDFGGSFFKTDPSDCSTVFAVSASFPNFNCTYFLSLYFETLSIFLPSLFFSRILPVAFLFPLFWTAIRASHSCPCQGM